MPDTPPFALRAAGPEDGAAVAAMCAVLARHEGGAEPRLTAAAFRRDGFGADPAFRCILAERPGGPPVGYAMYVPDYDTDLLCHGAYVADLYVENAARRCGIGRALMAAAARAAQGWGARTLCWNVLHSNPTARRFYLALGRELPDMIECSTEGALFDRLADAALPDGITLRRATAADAATLGGMLRALLSEEGIASPVADLSARLAADGFGPKAAFACHFAEREGEAVGYALHWPTYDTEPAARGVYLSDLYVTPQERRGGVARALLGAAARHGQSQGARYMEWKVRRDNADGRAFYATFSEEYPEVLPMIVSGDAFAALAATGVAI